MLLLTPEQLRIAAANAVGVLCIFAICAMYTANNKRMFLILNTVVYIMIMLMYALRGLWISAVTYVGLIVRNMYNAGEKPSVFVNMLILGIIVATALLLDDASHTGENPLLTYFPLVSAVVITLVVMFVKSYPLLLIAYSTDSVLWLVYNLKHALIMAMVTESMGIVTPAAKYLLSVVDRHFTIKRI